MILPMCIFSIRNALVAALAAAVLTTARPTASNDFFSIPIVAARAEAADALELPPTVIHQQNVNHGIARLHRSRGLEISAELAQQLSRSLQERVNQLPEHLQKRYFYVSVEETLAQFNQPLPSSASQTTPSSLKLSLPASKGFSSTKSKDPTFKHSIPLSVLSNDASYLGKLQIGTPPRDFLLLMDSGSADLWVGSERCLSDSPSGKCGNHKVLGKNSSSTFNATNEPWMIQYATGHVFGGLATDVVSVAGMELPKHKFGVATFESELFSRPDITFDGICGLAKAQSSKQGVPTLLNALVTSKLISAPIVSFKLPRASDSNPDGEITFGAMNPAKYDPSAVVEVLNVNQNGLWEAKIDRVTVAGQDIQLAATGVLDTGSSLFLAPESDVKTIHNLIPNARYVNGTGWTVPCNLTTSFSLTFGGKDFPVNPRDIAWLPVDANVGPEGECISGISVGGAGGDTWLVGDVFLKNVYLSTNEATDKITIAKLRIGASG